MARSAHQPPNPAYAADGETQHEAKQAGQAAAAGHLGAATVHLAAAQHDAAIAGTAAAQTAALQAYASLVAALQAIQAAHRVDNRSPNNGADPLRAAILASSAGDLFYQVPMPTNPGCADPSCSPLGPSMRDIAVATCLSRGGENCDTITEEMALEEHTGNAVCVDPVCTDDEARDLLLVVSAVAGRGRGGPGAAGDVIFVGGPQGKGLVPVPASWIPRVADNGKGIGYQKPGASAIHKDADSIRIMDPDARYPNRYVRIYYSRGQPMDLNGKPGTNATTHIPLP